MPTYRTVFSSKGQVVLPTELRERYGIEKGTRASWVDEGGKITLVPITMRRIKEIRGFLKPKPGEPSMFEEHMAERERERQRERDQE